MDNSSNITENEQCRRHREKVEALHDLYVRKNADYGDSFHHTYLEEGQAAVRIRLTDKLNRYKTLSHGNPQNVSDESTKDTLMDLANYAIMALMEIEREEENNDTDKNPETRHRDVM